MRLLAAPRIYGFLNGMFSTTSFIGTSVTEEGKVLCSVVCRDQKEMRMALGMDGQSMSRHAIYQQEYPRGYIVEWVPWEETTTHRGLKDAIARHKKQIEASHRGTEGNAVGS